MSSSGISMPNTKGNLALVASDNSGRELAILTVIHKQDVDLSLDDMVASSGSGSAESSSIVMPSKQILGCFACGKFGIDDMKCCSSCKCHFFCSVDCQKKAWKLHKPRCKALAKSFQEDKDLQQKKLATAMDLVEMERKLMSAHDSNNNNNNNGNGEDAKQEGGITCSICLDCNRTEGQVTLQLDCGHVFCYQCIKETQQIGIEQVRSLEFVGNCPLCRAPVPVIEQMVLKRVSNLLMLAKSKPTKAERDEVCQLALRVVNFSLENEPGLFLPRLSQGHIYFMMDNYEMATVAYKKAYNCLLDSFNHVMNNPDTFGEEDAELRKQSRQKDPSTDFPNAIEEIMVTIMPIIELLSFESFEEILMSLGSAMILSSQDPAEKKFARNLLAMVAEGNMARLHGEPNKTSLDIGKALAQCNLSLGETEAAKKFIQMNITHFHYYSGQHKIMAECELKEGNLEKALLYAGKGYFYEEPWNEATRAENLRLWNDIYQMILQKENENTNNSNGN